MRFLLCLLLVGFNALAQKSFRLEAEFLPADKLSSQINFNREFSDSIAIYSESSKIIGQLQTQGFLLAEISSLHFQGQKAALKITLGEKHLLKKLNLGNVSIEALAAVNYKQSDLEGAVLNPNKLQSLFEKLLIYYENSGFPFAAVNIDSIVIDNSTVSGALKVNTFEKFYFDSLNVVGNAKVNPAFLQTYLKIKPNTAYSEQKVRDINGRLQNLPYLNPVKSPSVEFTGGKANLTLYADKKNANQFDGVLGLQQNGDGGKTQLVGNLKLRLQNSLKRGELINLNYQGLANQSQILDLGLDVPNLLTTDFGIAPSLNIYKQDTSFLNLDAKLSVNYLLSGFNTVRFFVENRSTNLIAIQQYIYSNTLPPVLDASTTFYGLGMNLETLDYRFNPRHGFIVNIEGAVGNKNIRENGGLKKELYNDLTLSSTAYRFTSKLSYYQSLSQNLVLALYSETGALSAKNIIDNELFRIGGQRSLRGFNEMSILASAYTYANADLRYLFTQNSYLFTFYNQAITKLKTDKMNQQDYPLGFGAGINFETNIGILSVTYALGKQQNNPINLRQGKIHFGLVALF